MPSVGRCQEVARCVSGAMERQGVSVGRGYAVLKAQSQACIDEFDFCEVRFHTELDK